MRGGAGRIQFRLVHAEQQVVAERDVGADLVTDADPDAEFFEALADDGGAVGLTRLDPAAGEFPLSGNGFRVGALLGEQRAVAEDGRADDDAGQRRTAARKASQACGLSRSAPPAGFLESRTAATSGARATSTQAPLALLRLLLRHVNSPAMTTPVHPSYPLDQRHRSVKV